MERIKLPKELVAELRQHQRTMHDLIEELNKAESCGIDCQQMRSVHQDESKRIEALLQHYS